MFKRKLQHRIILLAFIILLTAGIAGGGTILYFQRQMTSRHFIDSAVVLASILSDSLERDMLAADTRHIQKSIEMMASKPPVKEISIISTAGRVFASSSPSSVDSVRSDNEISRVFASGETVTFVGNEPRRNLYVAFPVLNKPACYDCHERETTILGAIEIGIESKLLGVQLREQTLIMAVIAAATFLIMGGALTYVFRASVISPLSKLTSSARRIAGGDLSARVEIRRDDEIGLMATSFNEMAEGVEHHAQALEATKQELEETVQKRTQQLQETAVIRGQLLERLISAQEEERRRIARELHDEAGQAISAIMLDLARAIDALPQEASDARRRLQQSRALASQTLADLRKLIYDLRPEVLDQLGLAPALRSYVKSRLEDKNIKVRLNLFGLESRLSSSLETTIFRIVQEATTNVVRHSGASDVSISVAVTKSAADVSIDDNGKGFSVEAALRAPGSWGLRGMKERVSAIGGQLDIRSEPGQGTRIRFQIPVEGQSI